jgi:hypothetical protein
MIREQSTLQYKRFSQLPPLLCSHLCFETWGMLGCRWLEQVVSKPIFPDESYSYKGRARWVSGCCVYLALWLAYKTTGELIRNRSQANWVFSYRMRELRLSPRNMCAYKRKLGNNWCKTLLWCQHHITLRVVLYFY